MAEGKPSLVPKNPVVGLPWVDAIGARPVPRGMWVANRFSYEARDLSIPSIKEWLFVIDHMVDEPPPERLIGSVDSDSLVVNG